MTATASGKAVRDSSPHKSEKIKRLQSDNEHLRELIGLEPLEIEEWEASIPQALRDRYAAEAFFAEHGYVKTALKRLGINAPSGVKFSELLAFAGRIFGTPGCKALIDADLSDAEANRKQILGRMVSISLYGTDDASVRSTQLVAKMCGWEKPSELTVNVNQKTIFELIGAHPQPLQADQQKALGPAKETLEGFLVHEPGEPVRVSSDDSIDAMMDDL